MSPRRTLIATLALLALPAFAGCASNDEPGTVSDNEDAGDAPAAQGVGEAAEVRLRHDYAQDSPTTTTFTVPESAPAYNVNLKVGGDGPTVCGPGSSARLTVRTPTQEPYADLKSNTGNAVVGSGSGNNPCSEKVEEGVQLTPGKWTIEFTGSGAVVGVVEIVPVA